LNVTAPSLLPSLPQTGERGKNKSLCVLFFNSPLFKRGAGGDFLQKKKSKKINPPVSPFRKGGNLKKIFSPLPLMEPVQKT